MTIVQSSGLEPPYTNSVMQLNLFFRVFLGLIANICAWVPMRILWKNGEFAASMLCVITMILNLFYVVNALIWRDDNQHDWFPGYGWCDLQMYTILPIETFYAACFFTIMRNMATKVGMMRATSLSAKEKRSRNIREALIIFPIPLLQVILTYFVLAERFTVSTLIGCGNLYHKSWPYLVFYNIPTPVFTVLAVFYAILTWVRFRQVEKTTSVARNASSVNQRHQRMRRKLYLLALVILVPYFPIEMLFLYSNIMNGLHNLQPYNFVKTHNSPSFTQITYSTYAETDFVEMNHNYIAVLTVIPIFWFFGVTKEAVNTYRIYGLALGLGKWFPKLHDEYDPDRTRTGASARSLGWGAQLGSFLKSKTTSSKDRKDSILPITEQISQNSDTTTTTLDSDMIKPAPPVPTSNPWPDVSAHDTAFSEPVTTTTSTRNPFIFRTALASPFPFLRRDPSPSSVAVQLTEYNPTSLPHPRPGSDTNELIRPGTTESAQQWTGFGDKPQAKVRTHVWSPDDPLPSHQARPSESESEIGLAVGGGDVVMIETTIERKESL